LFGLKADADSGNRHLKKIWVLVEYFVTPSKLKERITNEHLLELSALKDNAVSSYINDDCVAGDKINSGLRSEPICLSCF